MITGTQVATNERGRESLYDYKVTGKFNNVEIVIPAQGDRIISENRNTDPNKKARKILEYLRPRWVDQHYAAGRHRSGRLIWLPWEEYTTEKGERKKKRKYTIVNWFLYGINEEHFYSKQIFRVQIVLRTPKLAGNKLPVLHVNCFLQDDPPLADHRIILGKSGRNDHKDTRIFDIPGAENTKVLVLPNLRKGLQRLRRQTKMRL
ncbi:hypothetical protein HN958_00865 [Candidatus Falkowbacteria bacterium]|jgi:hypothetical protein|nr:hypothetical protein [Candidatus Falkowbacteria bacterium]